MAIAIIWDYHHTIDLLKLTRNTIKGERNTADVIGTAKMMLTQEGLRIRIEER